MRAVTWQGKNQMRVSDVPEPRLLDDRDAIVRVTSAAICGSDLHLMQGYVPSMVPGDVVGHEFMGEVVDVAPGVSNLTVGDRIVVPFPIACGGCWSCAHGLYSSCENSNPNAWMAEKFLGHRTGGIFGYSHLTGGWAGGQAEYVRVPFADVNQIKITDGIPDEQVLFLGDILPTGWMGAECCDIQPGDTVAVWGAGPVGLLAMASAKVMGAERIIAIDRVDDRLAVARARAGATDTIDYEEVDVSEALRDLTAGRGPDSAIDAVGLEGHSAKLDYAIDKVKQAVKVQTDRPIALREAIRNVRNGGIVSVIGAYGGYIDMFPIGSLMNRGLTLRASQTPVHKYAQPLLEKIQQGELDPSFIVTHRLSLEDAPRGYDLFKDKQDGCVKVVLQP